jgi:hypothetical protein
LNFGFIEVGLIQELEVSAFHASIAFPVNFLFCSKNWWEIRKAEMDEGLMTDKNFTCLVIPRMILTLRKFKTSPYGAVLCKLLPFIQVEDLQVPEVKSLLVQPKYLGSNRNY